MELTDFPSHQMFDYNEDTQMAALRNEQYGHVCSCRNVVQMGSCIFHKRMVCPLILMAV